MVAKNVVIEAITSVHQMNAAAPDTTANVVGTAMPNVATELVARVVPAAQATERAALVRKVASNTEVVTEILN